MNREVHVPFCEKLAGKFRRFTHHKLHWVLDVTFKEDSSRVRKDNGAENLSIVRHITLNIFRQDKTSKESIKGRRYMAALDSNFADKVLDGLF